MFDLRTRSIINISEDEIFRKVNLDREQDHPESYSFRDDFICRQGNKVLYRIVKRENIKDKVKGWDNTVGRVDAYVL